MSHEQMQGNAPDLESAIELAPLIGALVGTGMVPTDIARGFGPLAPPPAPDMADTQVPFAPPEDAAREAQRELAASMRGGAGGAGGTDWTRAEGGRYRVESGGPESPDAAAQRLADYSISRGQGFLVPGQGGRSIFSNYGYQGQVRPEESATIAAGADLKALMDVQGQLPPLQAMRLQPQIDAAAKRYAAAQQMQQGMRATEAQTELLERQGMGGGGGSNIIWQRDSKTGGMVPYRMEPQRPAVGDRSALRQEIANQVRAEGLTGDKATQEIERRFQAALGSRQFTQAQQGKLGGYSAQFGTEAPGVGSSGRVRPLGMTNEEYLAYLRKNATEGAERMTPAERDEAAKGLQLMSYFQELDEDAPKYAGAANYTKHTAQRYAGILGKQQDQGFLDFRQALNRLQLVAFDFGGKQLTTTEKEFVLQTLPRGMEPTVEEFRTALRDVRDRISFITTTKAELANVPRDQYERELAARLSAFRTRRTPTQRTNSRFTVPVP